MSITEGRIIELQTAEAERDQLRTENKRMRDALSSILFLASNSDALVLKEVIRSVTELATEGLNQQTRNKT